MWFFGKKANRQPTSADVPPELQQYYHDTSWRSRLRGAGLYILPVVAAIVLVGAIVGGFLWLRHHNVNELTSKQPNQVAQQNQKANESKSQTSNGSQSGASQQPTTLPSDNQAQSGSTSQNGTSSQSTTSSGSSASNTATSSIPNTGPDNGVLLLSLATSVLGALAFHAHQLRAARR